MLHLRYATVIAYDVLVTIVYDVLVMIVYDVLVMIVCTADFTPWNGIPEDPVCACCVTTCVVLRCSVWNYAVDMMQYCVPLMILFNSATD